MRKQAERDVDLSRERLRSFVDGAVAAMTEEDALLFLCEQANAHAALVAGNNIVAGLVAKAKFYLQEARERAKASGVDETKSPHLLHAAAMVEAADVAQRVNLLGKGPD